MVKNGGFITIALACILIFSFFTLFNPIHITIAGEIITVGPGGSYNFTTIQAAVSYADPGDTINAVSYTHLRAHET